MLDKSLHRLSRTKKYWPDFAFRLGLHLREGQSGKGD
jgi:hypothetical protein